ncbi:MAG: preprotein translocase subunit SecG, partial [Deltaproteobacteria bacterium]|nr:preprotein translocase subunit SecG [Deltaproteobacteria bacterium]
MYSAITAIHILVAIILIISVLLQAGKNSGMGAAFGGSSGSVFGSRGPATLISRVTSVAAVIFMATSMTLSLTARAKLEVDTSIREEKQKVSGGTAASDSAAPAAAPSPADPAAPVSSENPAPDGLTPA